MIISGLQKMTLLDFPGKVACTVFLHGCNFRCPFCHNSGLLAGPGEALMDTEGLLAFLADHIGLKDNASDAESDLMKRILIYLQEHATEPITLSEAAAHFGYSAGRFSHIFNERIGCPFIRYVNSLRCQHAQQLLAQSDLSLIDVATACGFSSLRTFHRVYKDFTGDTPRAAQAR